MKIERNVSRRAAGMSAVVPFLLWLVALVGIIGVQVVVRQRMAESRQRVNAMTQEMGRIETALVDLRAQEGAMLTPESLNQRLRSRGTALVKIPPRSHIFIEESRKEEAVAMEVRALTGGAP
jgi:hypothetical protein